MEIALVVLGLLALGLAIAAGWLMVDRGRSASTAARAEAELDGARRESDSLREAARSAESRLADATAEIQRFGSSAAAAIERAEGLVGQLKELGVRSAREQAELIARGEREKAEAVTKKDDVWRTEVLRVQEVAAEKLVSAQREHEAVKEQLGQMDVKMREAFAALSREAMEKNSTQFLTMAEQRLEIQTKPLADTLRKTDAKLSEMESSRTASYAGLMEQVKNLHAAGNELRTETGRLVQALRKPEVRGRWGELQLRRIVELAGMVAYCDFAEQASQRDEDGRLLRPDLVVKLPNSRVIAVDAKCNTLAFLEATEAATEEQRTECLERFARHMSEQVVALGKKSYWVSLEGSHDFVVMFVPGDQILDAALARRADLLERAAEVGVILATPGSLIGLLRAVAVGWRERRIADQAHELFELGRELHQRAAALTEHLASVGSSLERTVRHYNDLVGSYESRMVPTLRKFEEAGAASAKALEKTKPIGTMVRVPSDNSDEGATIPALDTPANALEAKDGRLMDPGVLPSDRGT